MSKPIFVYIACKTVQEARKIAGYCVENRLAACGNILPNMESVYWWDGQINNEDETVLILKSTEGQYPELEKAVKANHSYECPCIVAIPIINGFAPYLNWIKTETKPLK